MAKKRIQNRIGDIYYVTLEDGARIYLQYVAIDTEQLYSPGNTNHLQCHTSGMCGLLIRNIYI